MKKKMIFSIIIIMIIWGFFVGLSFGTEHIVGKQQLLEMQEIYDNLKVEVPIIVILFLILMILSIICVYKKRKINIKTYDILITILAILSAIVILIGGYMLSSDINKYTDAKKAYNEAVEHEQREQSHYWVNGIYIGPIY